LDQRGCWQKCKAKQQVLKHPALTQPAAAATHILLLLSLPPRKDHSARGKGAAALLRPLPEAVRSQATGWVRCV